MNRAKDEKIKVGKGNITINHLVDRNDSDYNDIYRCANFFAAKGNEVTITPKISRRTKFRYDTYYGSLKGTKYYGKCPDLKVGDNWYELEGFTKNNPKRNFRNMMNNGLKQSDRLIIMEPKLTERYMKHCIEERIKIGQQINEIWLKDKEGNITLLYKKTDG